MADVILRHEICDRLRISGTADAIRKTLSRYYGKGLPRPFARGKWKREPVEAWLAGETLSPATAPDASNDDGSDDSVGQRRSARLAGMRPKS